MKHLAHTRAALLLAVPLLLPGMMHAQTGTTENNPPQTDGQAPGPPGEGGPHRGGPERRVEMLQERLGLSADQTTQVRNLLAAERPKMDALRSNTALSQDERRTQIMAIHQATSSQIRALLTPDQVTKYDAMEARMRNHRPGPDSGGPPDGPPPPPPQ